jgi:hexosaminidase
LGCNEQIVDVWTTWGVTPEVLCAGKETTYEFLENVLDEVIELFPSELIHIGGDECPKDRWVECEHCQAMIKALGLESEEELQGYLVARIERYLNSKGRRMIG